MALAESFNACRAPFTVSRQSHAFQALGEIRGGGIAVSVVASQ